MSAAEVRILPVSYLVTAWPEDLADNADAATWCITVEYRGHGLWAVLRGSGHRSPCLSTDGRWSYEHIPSERTDEWRAKHRFPLERALELAREMAPKVLINGMSAWECIIWHRERQNAP